MKWLKGIRRGAGSITEEADNTLEAITTDIKAGKTDINSIDKAIDSLPFEQVGDEVHVNNARWRDVEPKLRKGEIRKALEDMEVPHTVSHADDARLRLLMEDSVPDIDIELLDIKQKAAKKFHSDIDVKPGKSDGSDLEAKLDRKGKEKVTSIYSKLAAVAATGTLGAGIFCTLVFTGTMWSDLAKATNERNGCFVVYKDAKQTIACKLMNRTCGFGTAGGAECSPATSESLKYNIFLMCTDLKTRSDFTDLKNDTGIDLNTESVEDVLAVPDNIIPLVTFLNNKYNGAATLDVCTTALIEEGCVSCDGAALTNSYKYVDVTPLDDSMTLKCIADATILGTLVDVATEMGVDIFSAFGDSLSGSLRGNFFLFVGIILFIIVAIALVIKFKSNKNSPTESKTHQSSRGGVVINNSLPPNEPNYIQPSPNVTHRSGAPTPPASRLPTAFPS